MRLKEPGAYQLLSVLQGGTQYADGGWSTQVNSTQNSIGAINTSTTKGQPEIKPERTSEFEAGIDLGLFNDRADFGFTYYKAISRDVIYSTPLPPSTGFSSQVRNAGRIVWSSSKPEKPFDSTRPIATSVSATSTHCTHAPSRGGFLVLGVAEGAGGGSAGT